WGEIEKEPGVVPGWPPQVLDGKQSFLRSGHLVLQKGVGGKGERVLVAGVVDLALVGYRVVGRDRRVGPRRSEVGRNGAWPRTRTDRPAYFQDTAPAQCLFLRVHVAQDVVVDMLLWFPKLLVGPL